MLLKLATWPLRKVLGVSASLVVAAVTAVVVGYVTSQDVVFDALDEVSGSDPLLIHQFQIDKSTLRSPWALPAPLLKESVTWPLDQQGFRDLIESSGAVSIGSSKVDVTLEGNRNDTVIIENISARIVSRSKAPQSTFISSPKFGGPEPKIVLGFDLDSADRRARIPGLNGTLGDLFGEKEYFEIGYGEKFVFTFQGVTTKSYLYRWVIDLTLQFGGKHETVTIGKNSPYSVTGPVNSYSRYYDRVEWEITPTTAGQACPDGCTAMADKWASIYG